MCLWVGALFTYLQELTRTQKSHQARMCPLVLPEASPTAPPFYPFSPDLLFRECGLAGTDVLPLAGPKATLANVVSQPVLFWNFPYTLATSGGTAVCTHSQDGRIRYQPLLFEVIFLTSRSFFVGSIDGLIFGNYHLHPTPSLTTPGWWVLLVRVLSSGVTSHTAHKTKPAPCLPSQSLHSGRPPGLRPCLSCHHLGSATPLLSKSPSFLSSS